MKIKVKRDILVLKPVEWMADIPGGIQVAKAAFEISDLVDLPRGVDTLSFYLYSVLSPYHIIERMIPEHVAF